MTIQIKQYNDESSSCFIQIDVKVWDALDIYETRVYGHIKRRAGQNSHCWESLPKIASHVGVSRNKLISTLRSLVCKGLLIKEKGQVGGSDSYWLTPPKSWKLDVPKSSKKATPSTRSTTPHPPEVPPPSTRSTTPHPPEVLPHPPGGHISRSHQVDPCEVDPNTHPERVREAAPVVKISEPEPEPDPEPSQDPRISLLPAEELASTNNLSGEGEFSGGVVSQSTQNFNNRWNYSPDIAPITDEIIRLYNIGKPDNWTGIPGDCRTARKVIENKIHRLVKDGRDLSEIPKLMQNALLHCQSNDFYKKKEFGSGDIYWLCKDDRVEIAASKFQGSGESAKRKVATAILERENGIKHWEDGHVMRETEIHCAKRAIPKMRFDYPGLPPLEWVRKNMPDILKKLSPDYPEYPQKEELNYACN